MKTLFTAFLLAAVPGILCAQAPAAEPVTPQPPAVQAQPAAVEAQPAPVEALPPIFQAQPPAVQAQPPAVQVQTPAAEAKPQASEAVAPPPAPAAPAAEAPVSAIKVEKIVTAAAIEKKEPLDSATVFDKDTAQVFTWNRIISETVPAKIKHIYYRDGKKAGEITIKIGGSPWRIWSAKNVTPGSWKVEVTDENGAVLAEAAFTVSNEAKAEAPAVETPAEQPK